MAAPKPVVLLVDDDENLRRSLADLMTEDGCEVVEASTGDQAIAAAEKRPPALAVLDISLPGMSGIELCQKLRDEPTTARIKILMLTGSDDLPQTEAAIASGADSYITKPAEPAKLISLVRDLLGSSGKADWMRQKRKP